MPSLVQPSALVASPSAIPALPFDSTLLPAGSRYAYVGFDVSSIAFTTPGRLLLGTPTGALSLLAWAGTTVTASQAAPEAGGSTPLVATEPFYRSHRIVARQTERTLGGTYYFDASNPLDVLAVYPQNARVVFYDNNLAPLGQFAVEGAQWAVFARSADGNLWVLDDKTLTLRKQDEQGRLILKGQNIQNTLDNLNAPLIMLEQGQVIYLITADSQVLSFDALGNQITGGPLYSRPLNSVGGTTMHISTGTGNEPGKGTVLYIHPNGFGPPHLTLIPLDLKSRTDPTTIGFSKYPMPAFATAFAVQGDSLAWAAGGFVFLMPLAK